MMRPSHRRRITDLSPHQEEPSHPTAIPGVRIVHFGGRSGGIEDIRAYWLSRRAVFMHHSFEEVRDLAALDSILACADIVFLSSTDAPAQTEHYLALCCERADKPLIPLEDSSLSCLEEVLGEWCPIA